MAQSPDLEEQHAACEGANEVIMKVEFAFQAQLAGRAKRKNLCVAGR